MEDRIKRGDRGNRAVTYNEEERSFQSIVNESDQIHVERENV